MFKYMKEEAVAETEADFDKYMFSDLQGSLWIREAFLQAQIHTPGFKPAKLLGVTASLTLTCFVMVVIENMDATKALSFHDWYSNTSKMYWAYILIVTAQFAFY